MASQGYRDWLSAGRPYTLIRPAKAVQRAIRAYGITVYDYPNDAHLKAEMPEDHTPFSVTGWPGTNRRWNARALDVMPRSGSAAHRKENADIARQLIRDRDAGHPGVMWIKYLNWTAEDGTCRQERWTDAGAPLKRTTRSSSDRGHIHISGRSDVDDDDRADGYDPIARMRGNLAGEEEDMTPEQAGILGNAERILSAICTRLSDERGPGESEDRERIILVQPWKGGPTEIPNPTDWLIKRLGDIHAGGGEGGASPESIAREVADTFSALLGKPLP